MNEISIVRCPHCGDSWVNDHFTGGVCKCFKCNLPYVRDENTVHSYRFVFEAMRRTKGN